MERRKFVALASIFPTPLLGFSFCAKPALADGTLVSEDSNSARKMRYVADASKADRPKRGETEGTDQFCRNCKLFKPDADETLQAGKCQMISGGLVTALGWCPSWI